MSAKETTRRDVSKNTSSESFYPNRDSSLSLNLNQYLNDERNSSFGAFEVYPGTEAVVYDFTAERHSVRLNNIVLSTAYLIKGFFSAGVLNVHEAYMFAGLWTSVTVTVVFGIILCQCMRLLVKSAHKMYVLLRVPRLSYPELMEIAVAIGPFKKLRRYSKVFRYIADFCLFIQMFGTCCLYELIIATTMKKVLEAMSVTLRNQELELRIYVLIIMLPLIAVCLIRNLRYLAPFSLFADIFIGVCIGVALYYGMSSAPSITERPAWKSFDGLIRGSSIILYTLNCISTTLPVENNMSRPKYFFVVLQYGMTIVLCLVTVTGFLGYWGIGENSQSPITVHIPMNNAFPYILQFKLAIMLCVTFAVKFWVPFRLVWHYIGKYHSRDREFWERLYMVILMIVITCFTTSLPFLTSIMVSMGSFLITLTALIFPVLIDTFVFWNEHKTKVYRWQLITNVMIIMIALFLMLSTIYVMFNK